MELREFIEARLAEDELWALAASAPPSYANAPTVAGGAHWTWATGDWWTPYTVDPLEEFIGEGADWLAPTLVTVEEWTNETSSRPFRHSVLSAEEVRTSDGGHIVRHDPARVLREVAAKRAILKRHARTSHGYCDGCGYQDCDEPLIEDAEQCLELRDMASVWSDHPDYRTEWSVT